MRVLDTPAFREQVKRLQANQKSELDRAIRELNENPFIGEARKGNLAWVRVHRFRIAGQLSLLAFEIRPVQELLILHAIRSHENVYRDLKVKP